MTYGPKSNKLKIKENDMADETLEVVLAKILGAKEEPSIQQLTLYIPNKDKNGRQIKNLNRWIKEAQKVLTSFGGGSTAMPPADGTWLNPENKKIIWEKLHTLTRIGLKQMWAS